MAAAPPGVMPGMGPGFPISDPGVPLGALPHMYSKAPMGAMPAHQTQPGNLMQAGPPEPFQVCH